MFVAQRGTMALPDAGRTDPKAEGLMDVEERHLSDGPGHADVVAWYGKAKPGQPTLLSVGYGNAGSLATRLERPAIRGAVRVHDERRGYRIERQA